MSGADDPLEVGFVDSIRDVPGAEWDALNEGLPPFTGRAWLAATEDDGPVALEDGWRTRHMLVRRGGVLVGAVPLYERDRSDGEFVWHGTLEEALERSGLAATPRGVSTIPAIPVPSPRLLLAPENRNDAARARLLDVLAEVPERLDWASIHVQFCEAEEARAADEATWIRRLSRQAMWKRRGAESVEAWLQTYRAKRRTSIRREMAELERQGLTLDWVRAEDAPARLFEQAADLYAGTAERYGEKPRFGRRFFEALSEPGLRDVALFVTATPEGGEPVGIATMVVHDRVLYGRLWGAAERTRFLHFNVAVYAGIRYCLDHGLDRFEPGHGGFHKERRGFPTEPVYSLHRYREPGAQHAFAQWARHEWEWTVERIDESPGESGLKS